MGQQTRSCNAEKAWTEWLKTQSTGRQREGENKKGERERIRKEKRREDRKPTKSRQKDMKGIQGHL